MRVCVVGIGKIGLPIALQAASTGHQIIGADINPDLVEVVMSCKEPFPGEADLLDRLVGAVKSGLFSATTDTPGAVAESEAVIVAVPLVIDGDFQPDFSALDSATASIASGLRPGTLVSYETTVPVGTIRNRFTPALESRSKLVSGEDFFVCFSPERVFSGRIFEDLRKWPKIVGGIDQVSTDSGRELYESILEFDRREDLSQPNGVWCVESTETAEMIKLAETTYRDVNIALANEFSCYADRMGIRIDTVIEAANSQPFSQIHKPGVAVGGHCIPVYPHLYAFGDTEARMPALSRSINDSMPTYTVDRLEKMLGSLRDQTIAVLGAAYRGGVKETAFSGVFTVVEKLLQRGALPKIHDPLYSDEELLKLGFDPFHLGDRCDGMLLQADHAEYRQIKLEDFPGARAVIDGRGILRPEDWGGRAPHFASLGRGDLI